MKALHVKRNAMKLKLADGGGVYGMEIWLRDPRMVELMGQAGLDFIHIENEHVANDWEEVENVMRAAEAAGVTVVYRTEQCIEGKEPPLNEIIKALRCGAQVIKVPHVDTPEAARHIVEAVKYPPLGLRGLATSDRGSDLIPSSDSDSVEVREFCAAANEETLVWVIVESPEGLANVDAILDVEGIDAIGFGHQDFAISSGFASDFGPLVSEARARVRQAALRHGKQMWINTQDGEAIRKARAEGLQIVRTGVDVIELSHVFGDILARSTMIP